MLSNVFICYEDIGDVYKKYSYFLKIVLHREFIEKRVL